MFGVQGERETCVGVKLPILLLAGRREGKVTRGGRGLKGGEWGGLGP